MALTHNQQDHMLYNPHAAKKNPRLDDSKNPVIYLDTVDMIITGNNKSLASAKGASLEKPEGFINHFGTHVVAVKE